MYKLIIHCPNIALYFDIPKDIVTGPFNNAGQNFKIVLFSYSLWSFDWKMKVNVQFLRVKRDRRASSPLLLSPNAFGKNFEIVILLKILQRSDKKISGVDKNSQHPGPSVVIMP